MTWQTVVVARQELRRGLQRIRAAGGTVTSCLRCADGFRITCTFPTDCQQLGIQD